MRQNFRTKIYLACSEDSEKLKYVYIQDGYIYATNAHIVVKQSLESYCDCINKENLEGKKILADNFEKVYKYDFVEVEEHFLKCYNEGAAEEFATFEITEIEEKINFEEVIQKGYNHEAVQAIGIDERELNTIVKCLSGDSKIALYFNGVTSIIRVESMNEGEQIGFIMPILIEQPMF